jgi:CHAT domain-containing protein/tetratricopeptide (TPR) repeat protein
MDAPLLELVNNLYYTGAYGRALLKADEGLKKAKSALRRIQFHNAKGTVYAALGRTSKAKAELESALAIATRLDNPIEIAASHNNLGNALRLAGRFAEARAQFEKALDLDRKQDDQLGMAFDHANLGLTEELMGRTRGARHHLKRALSLSRKIGAPLNELKALAGLGRIDLAQGEARAALEGFRKGLSIADRLGMRNWSWRFRLLSGRALRKLGKPGQAQAQLLRGLSIVENRPPRIRKALGAPKVQEEPEDLYDEAVDLMAERGRAAAAFDLAERMRGRSFVDLVSKNAAQIPLEQARQLMKQITGLQMELEAARAAFSRAQASSDRAATREEIKKTRKELASARAALEALNPRLPALVSVDVWPWAKLKTRLGSSPALPAKAMLVAYAATSRRLVIFTVRTDGGGSRLRMHQVKIPRQALTRKVQRFREALLQFHQVEAASRELYQLLLKPVLDGGASAPEQLVIVPSGPLHVLPFAALHDGSDYVVARRTISYLPSANALRRKAKPHGIARSGLMPRLSFGWAGTKERPLSFSVRETEALGRTFAGASVVQGAAATKQRFLKEAPAAGMLHVATHAEFKEEAPLSTSLELADANLPLLEVLGLKLNAGLVILSACDTGRGPLDGADGVLGLQRAFLAAGAQRVIASLWRVSDLGTALLMKHLFRQLKKHPPAAALREAQNRVRRRFAHPAFWAGFRLDDG